MSSGLAWGLLVSPSVESKAERAGSSGLPPSPKVAEVLSWRLGSLGWATWGGAAAHVPVPGSCVLVWADVGVPGVASVLLPQTANDFGWGGS